jgi:hypothetical protein
MGGVPVGTIPASVMRSLAAIAPVPWAGELPGYDPTRIQFDNSQRFPPMPQPMGGPGDLPPFARGPMPQQMGGPGDLPPFARGMTPQSMPPQPSVHPIVQERNQQMAGSWNGQMRFPPAMPQGDGGPELPPLARANFPIPAPAAQPRPAAPQQPGPGQMQLSPANGGGIAPIPTPNARPADLGGAGKYFNIDDGAGNVRQFFSQNGQAPALPGMTAMEDPGFKSLFAGLLGGS